MHFLLHNNIVDWNVNQFDEESDESHNGESNSCCHGDFLEFWKTKRNSVDLIFFLRLELQK